MTKMTLGFKFALISFVLLCMGCYMVMEIKGATLTGSLLLASSILSLALAVYHQRKGE